MLRHKINSFITSFSNSYCTLRRDNHLSCSEWMMLADSTAYSWIHHFTGANICFRKSETYSYKLYSSCLHINDLALNNGIHCINKFMKYYSDYRSKFANLTILSSLISPISSTWNPIKTFTAFPAWRKKRMIINFHCLIHKLKIPNTFTPVLSWYTNN